MPVIYNLKRMASEETNQDILDVLTAVNHTGETRHQFQTSLLGKRSKNSLDNNDKIFSRQFTQPCHIKLSPSKNKGAPISKSNLAPFSEQNSLQYPKKFVSPANKDEAQLNQSKNFVKGQTNTYGLSQLGSGGWTSSSSGTRKFQAPAAPNPQKVLEFISPTFGKVRNNGLMFSDIMIPGCQYTGTTGNPTLDATLSAKNGKRINSQDTAATSSCVNKITIHKSNQGYDKFSNTIKVRQLVGNSVDSQSVQVSGHMNRNHIFLPQPSQQAAKTSFMFAADQLPTLISASQSFKQHQQTPMASKHLQSDSQKHANSVIMPAEQILYSKIPEKVLKSEEKNQSDLDKILNEKEPKSQKDAMGMTFSPSQDIKGQKRDTEQTPEKRGQLVVAKSLPQLSNRASNSKSVGVQSLIDRHKNMIHQAQTTQQKERVYYREVMGMNDTPLFIQSLDQQVHHPHSPPHANQADLQRFLELITTVNPDKPFSAALDHQYIAAALAYQKRQTSTSNQLSQRYQHIQSQMTQNNKSGAKITSGNLLQNKTPSPEKDSNTTSKAKSSGQPNTNFSSQIATQQVNLSAYQTISNEIVQGQRPPGNFNGSESGGLQRTQHKETKYTQHIKKFAVIASQIPLQSTTAKVSIISNEDYPKSSSQASQRKNSPDYKGKQRKKNVAGFKLNVNPSQGLISIASQLNQGLLPPSYVDRNQNMLDLALGQGSQSRTKNDERRTMIPMNGMQVIKKDLIDRPQNMSRPQTVHGTTSSSVDLTKEQLFQLNHPEASFVEQNLGNKELLQSIIKDIIMQRQVLHKQHLKNVNHIRRPSSSASNASAILNPQPHSRTTDPLKMRDLASAVTVSELIKLNSDLKDTPMIASGSRDNSLFIDSGLARSNTIDPMTLENFTKDQYLKIVQEWANLRKITTSFGCGQSDQQLSTFQKLAGQIFPLESMAASGGLGLLFDQFNNEVGDQRSGKDIIRKRLLNGRIFKPKQSMKNAQQNKQKEIQLMMPLYIVQTAGELIDSESNIRSQKVYPKANIEIFHKIDEESTSYADHPINKAIAAINSFIFVTYRSKASQSVNIILDHLKPEFKKFNLPMPPRSMAITGTYLRSKEFLSVAKYQLMTLLCSKINASNDFDPKNYETQSSTHKYFVGRGNNDHIVRVILKQRFYCNWTQKDKMLGVAGNSDPVVQLEETTLDDVNFVWTQVKRQHIVNQFDSFTKLNEPTTRPMNTLMSTLRNSEKPKQQPAVLRIYGKVENNYHLSNKKALFANMKLYYEALDQDPFDVLPLTFHIRNGVDDPEFKDFKRTFLEFAKNTAFKNVWIIKPGENTNRGYGIQVVSSLTEVQAIVRSCNSSSLGYFSTFIVQKYIERPLLIKRRKFDIRTYGLWTSINGVQKGYYYNDGYIRTSCKEYNTNNLNNIYIHLTNDAIQKKSDDYGKFENGNKLTFKDFQKYLDQNFGFLHIDFYRDLLPQIKKIVQDTYRAVYGKLDPQKRLQGFEIFGYDFMIDEEFRIYLIEVNTNPCLETSCPLLARIISEMLDNSLRIAFDPVFYHTLVSNQAVVGPSGGLDGPPRTPGEGGGARIMSQANTPASQNPKKQMSINPISDLSITLIKYELVFDEKIEGSFLREKILTKTMFDPADNLYLQEDDEQADKQEDACSPSDICIAKELDGVQVKINKPEVS